MVQVRVAKRVRALGLAGYRDYVRHVFGDLTGAFRSARAWSTRSPPTRPTSSERTRHFDILAKKRSFRRS